MKVTDFLKIKEKGEYKFINLNHVIYVIVQDANIKFHLMKGPVLEYSESKLGEEEFKNLKEEFFPIVRVSVI